MCRPAPQTRTAAVQDPPSPRVILIEDERNDPWRKFSVALSVFQVLFMLFSGFSWAPTEEPSSGADL